MDTNTTLIIIVAILALIAIITFFRFSRSSQVKQKGRLGTDLDLKAHNDVAPNPWIRTSKNDLNVIFIHGINSNQECWRHKNGSYWPELLKDENELADIGIYVFLYRTGINTGSYSLSDIGDSLKEYFKLDDLIDSAGVIFVCHSMGGIVTRRFLINQHSTLIEKGLSKIGLFLVASPSLGSEYANMLGLLSRVMGHAQASALRFSQSNVWLNDLDKEFINLLNNKNLQIKGKELIEDLPLYGKGFIKKQIVEPFSGAKYFGNSFKVPASDHSTIAAPADKNAVQHRLLVEFINEFIEEKFKPLTKGDLRSNEAGAVNNNDINSSSIREAEGLISLGTSSFRYLEDRFIQYNRGDGWRDIIWNAKESPPQMRVRGIGGVISQDGTPLLVVIGDDNSLLYRFGDGSDNWGDVKSKGWILHGDSTILTSKIINVAKRNNLIFIEVRHLDGRKLRISQQTPNSEEFTNVEYF